MIGLIFGDTDFPNKILKTIKKRKLKYLIIDLSKSKKFTLLDGIYFQLIYKQYFRKYEIFFKNIFR